MKRISRIHLYLVAACLFPAVVFYRQHIDNESHRLLSTLDSTVALELDIVAKRSVFSTAKAVIYPKSNSKWDGVVEMQVAGNIQYKYTFLDQRGYLQVINMTSNENIETHCLDEAHIPPIHQLEQMLTRARVVEGTTTNGVVCDTNEKMIQLDFAGEPFVFCHDPKVTDWSSKVLYGEDLSVSIRAHHFDETSIDLLPSRPNDFNCPTLQLPVIENDQSLGEILERWTESVFSRRRLVSMESAECSCKSKPRPCLFVHGAGSETEGELTSTFEKYWGKIHQHAPCCSSIAFTHFNTVDHAWHSSKLSKKVCEAAKKVSGSSDAINDVILVAHSMGNLMIANAIASGTCQFGENVEWVSLQGPFTGSKTADELYYKCHHDKSFFGKIIKRAIEWFGKCPTTDTYQSLFFEGGRYCNENLKQELKRAQAVYQSHVSAAMCGTSPSGLATINSAAFKVLDLLSGHSSKENDGAVDINSCRSSLRQPFGNTYRHKF